MIITEGLSYNDMEGKVDPIVTVDEYSAKMGKDSDIVTLSFMVSSEQVGEDLLDWFERGYDFVLDASISEGEVKVGKYLVFVEMNRRSKVPERIIELLKDLKTLTNLKLSDWTIQIDDEGYDADENILKQKLVLNPNEYKKDKEKENELNEMRSIAGLPMKPLYNDSEYVQQLKKLFGI